MEIQAQSEHIYAGEHRYRLLNVQVEAALADREVRLGFITPTGKVFVSEALQLSDGCCQYALPFTLLDAKGVLQAQILVTDGETLCAKSRVYCFEVERSVEEGETFDGDRLVSLAQISEAYTYLKTIFEQTTDGIFDYVREELARMTPTVDAALSTTSENPVMNKKVTAALNAKAANSDAVIGTAISMGRKSGTSRGNRSVAAGVDVSAAGAAAQAFGSDTSAAGENAHAEGSGTSAAGAYSHAEGHAASASAAGAHAEGLSTVAAGVNQHVQGKYNTADSAGFYAHIVGGGSAENARANIHTVDWNGNAWFAGEARVGGGAYAAGSRLLTAADIAGKADSASLAAVATSGKYADLTAKPDLSVYATSAALTAAKAEVKNDVRDRFIVTAAYDFSAGTITSFDIGPDDWTLNGERKEFVLRLTDGTRTVDLSGGAVSDLFAERRLLTGVLPSTSVMGMRHILVDERDPVPELVCCVLGFDDIAVSGSGFAYTGQRTDGTYLWISPLRSFTGLLTDTATGGRCRLGVENGLLYIEEVV